MGAGQWWDGFDPQELYVGPSMVLLDGIKTMKEAKTGTSRMIANGPKCRRLTIRASPILGSSAART
jgi:hypothetical protein